MNEANSKIVLYKGRKGSGKTLTMVKDGYKYFRNGWKILRTFYARFGEYMSPEELLLIDKNSKIFQCVIMIDELQVFFDSRRSGRSRNLNFSYFIQQIRKRGIILLATTQFTNTIDLRFRQHTDVVVFPHYIKPLKVCEVLYLDVTAIEDMALYQIELPAVKVVYDARSIFELYNTEELVGQDV